VSSWSTLCDAVLLDLTAGVPGLRGAIKHRYSPYDPEELIAEAGERHVAVYPVAASAQTAEPLVTGPRGDLLTEVYRIVYWEDAGDESSRRISDEDAAANLLDLAQAVRDRFYVRENYAIGGSDVMDTRYIGTALPERSGQVRWFAIGIQTRRSITGT
jgi:hypothetical protein